MALLVRRDRLVSPVTASEAADIATNATAIDMRDVSSGIVMNSANTTGDLHIYVCDTESGTYQRLSDSAGAPLAMVAGADEAMALPDAAFAAHFLKLIAASTERADLKVMLKG